MKIQEVLNLVEENIEEAFNKEAIQRKKHSTPIRVEKGKTNTITTRDIGYDADAEELGIKHTNLKIKGHVDSKGKHHEYDSAKVRQGFPSSSKHLADEDKPVVKLSMLKTLRKQGKLSDKEIRKMEGRMNNPLKREWADILRKIKG